MAKIRTLSQFQDALDEDMAWRIKEIAAFKIAVKDGGRNAAVFLRAGVALIYAHWEGFVKTASEAYVNFVGNQKCSYRELKSCFAVMGLKSRLTSIAGSRQAKTNIEIFDFVVAQLDQPARLKMASAIDTESNLTSRVFANIALALDIPLSPYETKFNLIDESLVRRRNKIAHGEYFDLSADDFRDLADEVLQLMRSYKTDLQNAATLDAFRR